MAEEHASTLLRQKAIEDKVPFIYYVSTIRGFFDPSLCFEWGVTRTFSGNQDVALKYKSEVIYVKFL